MKRLPRIVAMALLLSARRRLRAEEMAAHFGISLRTVYRDLAALEEAGFPVVGTPGDGYLLPSSAQLRPMGLEPEEAEALVMAARMLEGSATDGISAHLQAGVAKLEATLPPEAAHRLRNHRYRVRVPFPSGDAGPLATLLAGIHERRVVAIVYDGVASGATSSRDIEPLGLVRLGRYWLVAAYCRLREDLRTFRSDRILAATLGSEPFADREGMTLEDIIRERSKPS